VSEKKKAIWVKRVTRPSGPVFEAWLGAFQTTLGDSKLSGLVITGSWTRRLGYLQRLDCVIAGGLVRLRSAFGTDLCQTTLQSPAAITICTNLAHTMTASFETTVGTSCFDIPVE